MGEIIERQLLIRGRAFVAFSAIEKTLACSMWLAGSMLCMPDVWNEKSLNRIKSHLPIPSKAPEQTTENGIAINFKANRKQMIFFALLQYFFQDECMYQSMVHLLTVFRQN